MICDGYTTHARCDGLRFSFRPALHAERVEVMRMLKSHGVREEIVEATVRRHIAWSADNPPWRVRENMESLFHICMGWLPPEEGGDWAKNWESRDVSNLFYGVILEVKHPQFAKRSCSDCKKFWFNDDTGRVITRGGKPMLRPADTVLLCQTSAGCPMGTPEKRNELSEKNRMAWKHFQDCAAVGQFPDDPIVRRNARIIRKAIREARRGL